MKYKVSVIIPCYNAEDTLKRAIDSVINQSLGFDNIELLLYDDASTDDTANLIKEYATQYANIVPVLSKKNSGRPGKGRNVCIRKASSEFIMFMDNDDEYDKDMCKTLYNEIISDDFDWVSCNYVNFDDIQNQTMSFEYLSDKSSYEDDDKVIFEKPNIFYLNNRLIWNCIFKKKIIINNEIYFPEKEFAEDVYFTLMYMLYTKKLCYLKSYFGLRRFVQNDSLSTSFNLNDLKSVHRMFSLCLEKLKNNNLDLAFIFKGHITLSLFRLYTSDAVNVESKNEVVSFLKDLRSFEQEINLNYPLEKLIVIPNYLLMHERYDLTILYLKFLRKIYKSKVLRQVYRRFISSAMS